LINFKSIKYIGFDADDTLWENEVYYHEAEENFCTLLSGYLPAKQIKEQLLKTEIENIELYGFGAKAFTLSMIQTALIISDYKIKPKEVEKIVLIGKNLIEKPVVLIHKVEHVLKILSKRYSLIVATKGDLLDQERKLRNSKLEDYFHHIEIMSDKKEDNYQKLLNHLEIEPKEFLMIGNSFKSDISPVLNLGGNCIYIPHKYNWSFENSGNENRKNEKLIEFEKLEQLLDAFND
jgi:putative hydrolase of the HAD superfamily